MSDKTRKQVLKMYCLEVLTHKVKVPNNKIPNHKKFLIVNNRHWGFLQYIFPDKIEKTLYATIYISGQNSENIIFDIYFLAK